MSGQKLHDITNIPYFAYEPGIIAWCILAITVIAVIFYLKKRVLTEKRLAGFNTADWALREIKKSRAGLIESCTDFRPPLFYASIVSRRLVSYFAGFDISALSESELNSKSKEISNSKLKDIVSVIIDIEHEKYKSSVCGEKAESILKKLEDLLAEFRFSQVNP